MPTTPVTDDEIVGFVRDYADSNGLVDPTGQKQIGLDSSLADLGLDSIGVAELMLSARYRLVEEGRVSPDATLFDLPALETVADLGALLRSLEG